MHGLIGESGSGKTQTAFSVLRLLPHGGRIVAGGRSTSRARIWRTPRTRTMTKLRGGEDRLHPAGADVQPRPVVHHRQPAGRADAGRRSGSRKDEAKERALELLARVGIPEPAAHLRRLPARGLRRHGPARPDRRRGLLRTRPAIADEPTTALDVTVQAEVLDLLRELQSEFEHGRHPVVTHNFGVVADLCDRVSVMRNGRIVETGPARSIFADPQHEYTQSLFDAILEDAEPRGPLASPEHRRRAGAAA